MKEHIIIHCIDYRPFESNTLQGFATFELVDMGLVLKDYTVREKNGSRWVSPPSRSYKKRDGTTDYVNLIGHVSTDARQVFQTAALEALDSYRSGCR